MGEGLFPTIHDKCSDLGDEVRRLKAANELLMAFLREALPHVEKMANVLATGPIAGPIEHLADDIQAVLAKVKEPGDG